MGEIQCHCGENVTHQFLDHYDLDADEKLLQQILDGSFLSLPCPNCGNILKLETQAILEWKSQHQVLGFYPESDRDSFLIGVLKVADTITRVCFGYKELVEKLKIIQAGLEDRAIEILKFSFLRSRPATVSMLFTKKESDKLVFYLEGLKDDEVGVTSAPYQAYEKILEQLNAGEPRSLLQNLQPPYVHVSHLIQED